MHDLFLGVVRYFDATCFPLAFGVGVALGRGFSFFSEIGEVMANLDSLHLEDFWGAEKRAFCVFTGNQDQFTLGTRARSKGNFFSEKVYKSRISALTKNNFCSVPCKVLHWDF